MKLMRCDLHVHSWHSGRADLPVLEHVGRECYSDPLEVYERATVQGMDLVTLTDHDTIDGALRLRHLPNTFVSEEVTVVVPGGRQLHVNVFDIHEHQHRDIQRRRGDAESLFAYLAEERLPASVNHLFSALTGPRAAEDLHLPLAQLPLIEALNGSMPQGHNQQAATVGRAAGMGAVGGSDAHSLLHVARAFTRVPGARTKEQFLAALRCGLTLPAGRSGSYTKLTSEVARIFAAGYRETAGELRHGGASSLRVAASLALLPLLPLLPLFTLGVYLYELRFAARHYRALAAECVTSPAPLVEAGLGEAA
ncbi:MAG TPA: PHP-associated domain-containing protein [Vicinamibacteria bacterium]|nr:PHP-associated domain-containing protein [Vicinamibacteria bacterium]